MSLLSSRLASILRSKSLESSLKLTRSLARGVIPARNELNSPESTSTLPSNIVILGANQDKVQRSRLETCTSSIPGDCEIVRRTSEYPAHMTPPQVWLHSFESPDFIPSAAVELHPEVFASHPRMDFIHECKEWQEKFKEVDYSWAPTRGEMGRGKKKPWPQKGTGRARHGSRIGPQWKGGGIANGPRGPRALFRKINPTVRLHALTSALTIKNFQNNLLIVNDFSLPSPEPSLFRSTLAKNHIDDKSALLVFSVDENLDESSNIFAAVADWPKINLMPLIALNVWSLLHHEWLVLTSSALDDLERKVTWHLHRYDWIDKPHNFYRDLPFEVRNSIPE